jgi:hypothetical protein
LDDNYIIDKSHTCHIEIPLQQSQKVLMAGDNPIAVAKLFKFLQTVLFEQLLGIAIDSGGSVKKTFPRMDDSVRANELRGNTATQQLQITSHLLNSLQELN